MSQQLPPKKDVALALLERSNVDVYLDPRATGVVVPAHLRKDARLVLKIGLNMPVPIPDLRLDDDSMSCTLSFSRTPFYCVIPWPAIFAMVGDDGRGMVWPDDVPQELAVRVEERRRPDQGPARPGATRARSRSKLADDPPRAKRDQTPAPARPKRPRKKKEDSPNLVALPSQSDRAARASAQRPRATRPGTGHIRSVGTPPPSEPGPVEAPRPADGQAESNEREAPAPAPSARPKRELPPYLRVVK